MSAIPNILWILTTQWRGQALGLAGDSNARTPFLDQLARQGLFYENAYTPHPFGPFARAALLTGIRSPQNGVRDYYDPLPRGSRTIAHALSESGVRSAFIGKWHLAPKVLGAPLVGAIHAQQIVAPEDRGGFPFWEGFEGGFQLNDPWLQGSEIGQPRRFQGYQSDLLCERASQWIERQEKDKSRSPWFCLLSLEAPHPPYAAHASGIEPYAPERLALPANLPSDPEIQAKARTELSGYYAHIEATDRAIGRLLGCVQTEDTIVVFSSVHGDMHGAHGLFRKGWPYEESVRVPLIVRGLPGRDQETGRRVAAPVSLMDLRRWTLGWASEGWTGIPMPEKAFVELSMPCVVRLPHQCDRIWNGCRTATHKHIFNADGSPWLSFDLENDPLEINNLCIEQERS